MDSQSAQQLNAKSGKVLRKTWKKWEVNKMSIDTWRVERLRISEKAYCALKNAGLDTFGDVKAAGTASELAAISSIDEETARRIQSEITKLEQKEAGNTPPARQKPNSAAKRVPEKTIPPPPEEGGNEQIPTTLEELEDYNKETITPEIAAGIIGCNPQTIRSQAQADAGALGFPVIILGRTVKIPRRGFLYFMQYGHTSIQHKK